MSQTKDDAPEPGNPEGIKGYSGKIMELLTKNSINVGDRINVKSNLDEDFYGILMPRYESSDKDHLVLKLKSGYNIGIHAGKILSLSKVSLEEDNNNDAKHDSRVSAIPSSSGNAMLSKDADNSKKIEVWNSGQVKEGTGGENNYNNTLPRISLLSTGGTIASKIDYRTGGVRSALSASELYAAVPELKAYAKVDPEVLLSEYSENLKPEHWTLIAKKVSEKVKSGLYDGIVISHGTDTMHYTAAALSFALKGIPIPLVIVGAQRSSDRPSSDAASNLIAATIFATRSQYAGVFVTMHANSSDEIIACHVGTRVRKNHTSRRDAFKSIDTTPVAYIAGNELQMQEQFALNLRKRNDKNIKFELKPDFDSKVILLKYYPGFDPSIIRHVVNSGHKAIVIEGTGLGHVSRDCFAELKNAIRNGVYVFMTSQCIWGRTKMTVYDTGRDLLKIGVIPLSDMIAEAAVVKAMWVIANSGGNQDIAKKIMQENIANEISYTIPIS